MICRYPEVFCFVEQVSSSYYRELVEVAVRAGEIMISSGAETHRVEDTITRILETSGFSQAEAFVLPTGITVTLSDEKEQTLSVTRRVLSGTSNLSRVYCANNVSRDFCAGKITLDEARDRLEKIRVEHANSVLVKIIGTMLATGAFAVLFGGSLLDGLAAMICGLFVGLENYYLRKFIGRDFLCDVFCAATITITTAVIAYFAGKTSMIGIHPQYIIVGGIMPLVPGVAITNAIRDVLQGDFISACARLVEAFMIAAAVAVGVGAGLFFSNITHLISSELGFVLENDLTGFVRYAVGAATAFLSIVGFTFIMEVPMKFVCVSSAVATVVWLTYLFCTDFGNIGVVWASFAGAAVAEALSYVLARLLKAPVTIFLICGILPLVPGAYIYLAVYCMINSDPSAGEALLSTLTIAGAIALGIIVMDTALSMISKGVRRIRRLKNK